MTPSEIVGKRITEVLKTRDEVEHGDPIPGISDGTMVFFRVLLKLESGRLVELGKNRKDDPLVLHANPSALEQGIEVISLESEGRRWLNRRIANVHIHPEDDGIVLELDDGNVCWVEDDLYGTELRTGGPDYLAEEGHPKFRDYFTNMP